MSWLIAVYLVGCGGEEAPEPAPAITVEPARAAKKTKKKAKKKAKKVEVSPLMLGEADDWPEDLRPPGKPDPKPEPAPSMTAAEPKPKAKKKAKKRPAPKAEPRPAPKPPPTPKAAPKPPPEPAPAPEPEPAPVVQPAPAPQDDGASVTAVEAAKDCPPQELMPTAESGELTAGQVLCLENALDAVTSGFDRDRISLVLVADAQARDDVSTWERRVEKHLREIDEDNPGLALRYAVHLWVNGGLANADRVLHWTDKALLNQAAWTGDVYAPRVYSAHKLRAAVGQARWKAAEEARNADPTAGEEAVEAAKVQTRKAAADWYEFAVNTGLDAGAAQRLCQLAGETRRCEG